MIRAIAVVVLLSTATTNSAQAESAIQGEGVYTCAEFARFFREDPKRVESYFFTWAQGFMSGLNAYALHTTGKSRDLTDVDSQLLLLQKECDAHPLERYEMAVSSVYHRLKMNTPIQPAPDFP